MITIEILTVVPALIVVLAAIGIAALIYPYIQCFLVRGMGGDCRSHREPRLKG